MSGKMIFYLSLLLLLPISFCFDQENGRGDSELENLFSEAAAETGIPCYVLKLLAYSETHFKHRKTPSMYRGWGIMNLREGGRNPTLALASRLTGLAPEILKKEVRENIRGAAHVLRFYRNDMEKEGHHFTSDISSWFPLMVKYSGITSPVLEQSHTSELYNISRDGVVEEDMEGRTVVIRGDPFIRLPEILEGEEDLHYATPDYPSANWVAAASCNYTNSSRGVGDIHYIIIHVAEGSYSGTISWFQNCDASATTHYVIRSSDGEITQMVEEEDIAWHAGNWTYNQESIGYEHEGYVSDCSYFTETMYRSSAELTCYLCDKYGIPIDRTHIIGHNEVPGATHTDPGPCWDWSHYIDLVNEACSMADDDDDVTGDDDDDDSCYRHDLKGDRGHINGNVYWVTASGEANTLSGALVVLDSGTSTETNYLGNFAFIDVQAGWHYLSFRKEGYLETGQEVNVLPGQTQTIEIPMEEDPDYIEDDSPRFVEGDDGSEGPKEYYLFSCSFAQAPATPSFPGWSLLFPLLALIVVKVRARVS